MAQPPSMPQPPSAPQRRGPGRPRKAPTDHARTIGISLAPALEQLATQIGHGSPSAGVQAALRYYAIQHELLIREQTP